MDHVNEELIKFQNRVIEVLWSAPDRAGPWPLLLFVHGHTLDQTGAAIHLNFLKSQARLKRWGVCIASMSQPGYGQSTGPADYCGPNTQAAISTVLKSFCERPYIDPERVALIGYSRGAIACSMVATEEINLAAVVLGSGFYDFKKYFDEAPNRIKEAIQREAPLTPESIEARSALNKADSIEVPMLIFHGGLDERGGVAGAHALADRAPMSELRYYPGVGHLIPFKIFFRETRQFLRKHLSDVSRATSIGEKKRDGHSVL